MAKLEEWRATARLSRTWDVLLGRRSSSPVADINLARDDGPLGHDKPWCDDVANDRACRSKVELLPGSHVSCHRAANVTFLATTSALTVALDPMVKLWSPSSIDPSTSPSIVKSSVLMTLPSTRTDLPIHAPSRRS